jgi:Fe-S oxidoreductase
LLTKEQSADVLLFPDTFTRFYEPAVGVAAFKVLRALGRNVRLGVLEGDPVPWELNQGPTRLWCCGRPLISNGMLDEAVRHARHNVERLHAWAESGKPITACEPSCVLTIKDDYPALLRNEERRKADAVARVCLTFEEAAEVSLKGRKAPPWKARQERLLVQAHCHQRSLVGVGPMVQLLRRVPDVEVVDLGAGCCGMAGSFGYEKEHYDLSRRVGEQRLFPALRAAKPGDVVIAPGFSCRQQIHHFLGLNARHPAEVLERALNL